MAQEIVQKGSDAEREEAVYSKRQQHRRLSVRMPVRVSSIDAELDPDTGKPFFRIDEESSMNVSSGGVFVCSTDAVTPGRRVLVEIEIPGGDSVRAVGEVVWKRVGIVGADAAPAQRPGFAVRFLAPGSASLAPLERFLARASQRRRASNAAGVGLPG